MSATWTTTVARKREAQGLAVAAHQALHLRPSAIVAAAVREPDVETVFKILASAHETTENLVASYIARAVLAHQKLRKLFFGGGLGHSITTATEYSGVQIDLHQSGRSLTEILFEDAIQRAQALDGCLADGGGPVGPLHGIPMTLKDQFNVEGYDSSIGYVGRAFSLATEDCTLVRMLRSLGAVILAKTNLPQSIMWCETENPLWGLTTNPMDEKFTPGGSTGGESALLALQGSMVGWGTDIGGSIRIPSHMMGLYGLKPSSGRLPYHGVPVSTEGQEHVPSSVGPMARSLASIEYVMRNLVRCRPWEQDARCVPIPWRQEIHDSVLSRPLTVGVLLDDEVVRPHPPVARVLRSVVAALEGAGHDVVEWNATLHPECIAVMDAFYSADGCEDILTDLAAGGEPCIPHVKKLTSRGQAISVYEYWQLNKKKWALQQRYLEKWNSMRSPKSGQMVDVVIMPPMPHTSVPHGGCRWVGYTKVWNLLDYTALVIPAGKVQPEDRSAEWQFTARNEMDAWNLGLWETYIEDMIRNELPVGIQIVGRKLEEEKVLGAARVIDQLIHG